MRVETSSANSAYMMIAKRSDTSRTELPLTCEGKMPRNGAVTRLALR